MKNRKGFTIVELVIVIAVIAILAAVLIPTFSGVVQKANESGSLQKATSAMKTVLAQSDNAVIANGTLFVIGDKTEVNYIYEYSNNQMKTENKKKSGTAYDFSTTVAVDVTSNPKMNVIIVPSKEANGVITPSDSDTVKSLIKAITGSQNGDYDTTNATEQAGAIKTAVKTVTVGTTVYSILVNTDFADDLVCFTYSK